MDVVDVKLQNLKPVILSRGITSAEGGLFYLDLNGKKKIVKIVDMVGSTYYNSKMNIVRHLNNNQSLLPCEYVIPEGLVKDKFIYGFYMPYVSGTNLKLLLYDEYVSHDDKIKYLKMVGALLLKLEKLNQGSNLNVHLNDLHEANFIITYDEALKVIDLDSSVICDAKAFPSKYLSPFSLAASCRKYEEIDEEHAFSYIKPSLDTDLYCYIIMIINYIIGVPKFNICDIKSYKDLLTKFSKSGFDKELVEIFSLILSENNHNINPVSYLDLITEENVMKLRKRLK